jgi:hypothetical protein
MAASALYICPQIGKHRARALSKRIYVRIGEQQVLNQSASSSVECPSSQDRVVWVSEKSWQKLD